MRSSIEPSRATSLARALADAEELELVTRGRRTGQEHRVLLWFAHEDGVLFLRTDTPDAPRRVDWYRNLRREPDCRVVVGGHELAARYESSDDREADLRHVVELWRAKYGAMWVQDWFVERGRLPVKLRLVGSQDASLAR